MNAAIKTLRTGARQLRLAGELDPDKFAWAMTQLRTVANELAACERRASKEEVIPVDITALLSRVLGPPASGQRDDRIAPPSAGNVMVRGPLHDLQDLLNGLIEYARSVYTGPMDLRTSVRRGGCKVGDMFTIELAVRSLEIPDFVRRKLWDAASIRGGEVSVVSEPDRCWIRLTLPTERRLTEAHS